MNFLTLYVDAFKRILDFKGKSDRTAFWSFVIISFLITLLLAKVLPVASGIYGIAALVAGIMLGIRRARDAGNVLLALTMIIPPLGLIVLGLLPRK